MPGWMVAYLGIGVGIVCSLARMVVRDDGWRELVSRRYMPALLLIPFWGIGFVAMLVIAGIALLGESKVEYE